MNLPERLAQLKADFATKAPPAAIALMHRATEDLKNSGQVERALGVGARAPAFELASTLGGTVASRDVLARGPMVLSFYRGLW